MTQSAEASWEITVASAAPLTPMSSAKMKIGSSTMFRTAPISTVSMPLFANPCALMKPFMPREIITNTLPNI